MGLLTKLLFLLITIAPAIIVYKLLIEPHPRPIVEDEYWGPSSLKGKKEDESIRPFKIDISLETIEDLKLRLKRELDSKRLLPPLEGVGFEYGFNSKYLQKVGEYWLQKYDWRAREKLLNRYPHFKTKIAGLDIHFQHVKPKEKEGKKTRPLLLLHSFPVSFVEFQKIIPLLTEPKNSKYNYELVMPSIPGFAFSDAASRRGLSPTEIGNIFKRLMKRLGHEKFFAMGGDWGALILTDMATVYPENIIAAQSTMCYSLTVMSNLRYMIASAMPSILMTPEESQKVYSFLEYIKVTARDSGFAGLQATKPDTGGVGMTHSPLALASYVLEKFSTFTNRNYITREDGGLEEKFTLDELLDNVMIYWVTASMVSVQRLDAELFDPAKKHQIDRVPTSVPFSCQYLSQDLILLPNFALRDKYLNFNYTISDGGGHFGALEVPEVVAQNAISHFENY